MKTTFVLWITLILLLMQDSVQAQRTVVQNADQASTEQIQKPKKEKGRFKKNWKLPYPNPYRAGVYSFIIPGAGQIYNKRYWKAPIVWGAFGALIYSVDYNKNFVDQFGTAYAQRLSGMQDQFADLIPNAETLRRLRNQHRKNLQMTYIGFVGMYALSALDAYVDAHLKSFDISDDLSLQIQPIISGNSLGNVVGGVGLTIYLN